MATITTDTFLDDGTARTAGEAWTISSGADLIIRTDTRWHAGSPASMTGSLGSITCQTAGGVLIDGTKVRWATYVSGSGTVPAIGTSITQGGVTGYLLGVWANLSSAPLTVGSAVPATGFLKFREVTNGPFANAAVSGISATISSETPGWIEVVIDSTQPINLTSKGLGFRTTGDWFYLGDTNGSRGQTFQVPTNGGGAGTFISGCQIETAPGSNVYEWYSGVSTATWTTANIFTDERAKLFEAVAGGLIRIGSNAAATPIGHLPASGCKVRIPNIIMRQCAAASRSANVAPATDTTSRATFSPSVAGASISFDKSIMDWGLSNTTNKFYFTLKIRDASIDGSLALTTPRSIDIDGLNIGQCGVNNTGALAVTKGIVGTIKNVKTSGTAVSAISLTLCDGLDFADIMGVRVAAAANTTVLNISTSSNITVTNITTINGGISVTSSKNISIKNHDYTAYLKGPVDSSHNTFCLSTSSSSDVTYDGLTFGLSGLLQNCHTYGPLFNIVSTLGGIKIFNLGTRAAPLSVGATSATWPDRIAFITTTQFNLDVTLKRVYLSGSRSGFISFGQSNNCVVENSGVDGRPPFAYVENTLSKGLYGTAINTVTTSGFSANAGLVFSDMFSSDTAGKWLFIVGSTPTAFSAPFVSNSIAPALNSGYDDSGTLNFTTNGDSTTIETPYYVLGHTAFENTAITGLTTADCSYTYWLDTGSGYGASKSLTLANLLTETLNPAGTKMKIQLTRTSAVNLVSHVGIVISTVSTLAAQTANLYPLSTNTLTLTGLVAGSEIRCYTGSDPATAVEIGGTENSGTSFSFTHSAGGSVGYIRIFALGYQPVNYDPYTYEAADTSLLVQQTIDRNYVNPS